MNPRVRLLAIDIDGTLLNSKFQLSPAVQHALQRAHRAGVEILLVTGRRHLFALPIAQEASVPLWLISSNGAVTRSLEGELFHQELLPLVTAQLLCRHMDEFRRHMVLTFECEGRGALVLESMSYFNGSIFGWVQKNRDYIAEVAPIEQSLTRDPIQAMYCGGVDRMREVMARLEHADVAPHVTVVKTEYPKRDLCIVDILNAKASKAAAVERWARHRGFERAQVAAIGDNFNDVAMLAFAGVPFIMGNADPELKQNGWRVLPSNDEDGVAAAVDEILNAQ
ncbi:MAG TPA: Cof-type HAD-IIB family hydrolase [Terriglobales bacterium]|nr:Cof-type HAD-IIB family hydrolase [Terriglobales bacterium]